MEVLSKDIFEVGQIVTNNEIAKEFKCAIMGGMRRSKEKNALILINDHTKGLYEDKWFGDKLHYTGMGQEGDQRLDRTQNRTLAESVSSYIDVHLFEVLVPTEYIYRGLVELYDEPYQEEQEDKNGNMRKVWMFPLQLINNNQPLSNELFRKYRTAKENDARSKSLNDLKNRIKTNSSSKPSRRKVETEIFVRDEYVAEYTKRIANGKCQLCKKEAPFKDKKGNPYLESHHIEWLSKGGSDSIDNTIALCANCHKKMHILDLKEDVEKLKKIASNHK